MCCFTLASTKSINIVTIISIILLMMYLYARQIESSARSTTQSLFLSLSRPHFASDQRQKRQENSNGCEVKTVLDGVLLFFAVVLSVVLLFVVCMFRSIRRITFSPGYHFDCRTISCRTLTIAAIFQFHKM